MSNLMQTMATAYALNSKERFPSYNEDIQEKRIGTTFYGDFKVAEAYGMKGIEDTWKRVWAAWRNNFKYVVELAVVLNHLCWEHHAHGNADLQQWYSDHFYEVDSRIYSNGTAEEPLPEGCKPFTAEEHKFAFDVLD